MNGAFKPQTDMIAGKYRLDERLGVGGMAEVWSATNAFTDRQVAIKLLRPTMLTAETLARFFREARVSARVNHPNIVEVIDVGATHDDTPFMVMELLRGRSLDRGMRRPGGMSVQEYALSMRDVAAALGAAHASGVIHRDLKPTNIFLADPPASASSGKLRDAHSERGFSCDRPPHDRPLVKVLDFGISKFLDEERGALTMVGTVLGSPSYMSPEQARGEECDARTDIFSYGALWFEAITGTRPFTGANYNAIIVATATHEPKNIDTLAPQSPAGLRSLIRHCLERNPKKRPATFEHVLRSLEAAMPEIAGWRANVAFAGKGGLLTPTPSLPLGYPLDMGALQFYEVPVMRRKRWLRGIMAASAAVIVGAFMGRCALARVQPIETPARANLVYLKTNGITFVRDGAHPVVRIDSLPVVGGSKRRNPH